MKARVTDLAPPLIFGLAILLIWALFALGGLA